MDNKSCHSQEEKRLNIHLNKDADGSNPPIYVNLDGSYCARTPDDKKNMDAHFMCDNLECSLLISCARFAINVS